MLWYDPRTSVTDKWDTTGQVPSGTGSSGLSGQVTSCNIGDQELVVAIDNVPTHRPNLLSDLNYTPFGVGFPNQDIIFTSFTALPGIAQVDLHWETTKEANLVGYYVTRSLDPAGPYNRDSSLIPAKGNDSIGGIYDYNDTGLENGTTYWYMLEMLDGGSTSTFHGPANASTFSMVPTATEVTPSSIEVYGSSVSLKVKGNNFIPTSKVVWENDLSINLQTSYISSTELTAILPSTLYDDSDSSNIYEITVYNPGSGGGFSPPLNFTVKNPVPTLTSITPDYSDGNSTTISISVKGTLFVHDSEVRFNGSSSNITTTFVDRNNLTASVQRSKLTAGIITITVFNPAYGGGTSGTKSFSLYTPTPTLTKYPTAYKSNTPYSSYRSPTPQRTRTRTPTVTRTGTILITPSTTQLLTTDLTQAGTPDQTTPNPETPEPSSATPTLAPGEPTYTQAPPSPEDMTGPSSIWSWRFWSILRLLGGSLLGVGLLSIPAFFIFRRKTSKKNPR